MIDWDRVRELKDEIGDDDFAEVAEMFIGEVDEVIDRLRRMPDPSLYEADMHFIKSSALNLGFADLAGLCETRERQAASGAPEAVDLGPVFSSYAASKTALFTEPCNGQT